MHIYIPIRPNLRNDTNNLPLRLITLHQLMRLHNLLKRQNPINKDLKRPIAKPGTSMFDQLIPQLLLIALIATPQRTPLKPHPLPKERANIHPSRERGTSHNSKTDNAAIQRRRVQIPLEVSSANEVDDQINALSVRGLENLRRPVLCFVVESRCCAQFAHAEVDLLG